MPETDNIMVKINGESFRCDCGCNVFHKPDKDNENKYVCNSCYATYTGEA